MNKYPLKVKIELLCKDRRWSKAIPGYRKMVKDLVQLTINNSYLVNMSLPSKLALVEEAQGELERSEAERTPSYEMPSSTNSTKILPTKVEFSVSVVLADDNMLHEYNLKYRNIDKTTNVLSFPLHHLSYKHPEKIADIKTSMLGDILISLDTITREAENLPSPVILRSNATQGSNSSLPLTTHFAHMIVHGTLHLLGYDHIEDDDAEVMESLEKQILSIH